VNVEFKGDWYGDREDNSEKIMTVLVSKCNADGTYDTDQAQSYGRHWILKNVPLSRLHQHPRPRMKYKVGQKVRLECDGHWFANNGGLKAEDILITKCNADGTYDTNGRPLF